MTKTQYAGVGFSTLLHARWALICEDLGVPWSYRPITFPLSGGSEYEPDFWLPQQRIWMQVPGEHASMPDYRRWREFAAATEVNEHCTARHQYTPGMRCEAHGLHTIAPIRDSRWLANLVLYNVGDIPAPKEMTDIGPVDNQQQSMLTLLAGGYQWTRCADCGTVTAAPQGLVGDLGCGHTSPSGAVESRADDPGLMMAFGLARQTVAAEFDGGQCAYCDDPIAVGDLIAAGRPVRRRRWYHANCLLNSRRERHQSDSTTAAAVPARGAAVQTINA
ncbi:hypothetical protein [Actinoplanes teichomyceticus]|uniref:Uncharacterized protein n=1 Tax=Actinoplanes teichomyceticus TaxID=1867 RepID=A0A561VGH7_ACTTI|nr:hypothetical protein [Actinoplanes teichomyceticus]TWG10707.1 hypothetical protein FHX34_107203 [Actinoplanes teichomyceticus]GIF15473.1 hypothetical protein Ate01nite_55050 [Actinoplanes teichomyceticus]